jgi:hypothetical protein
MLAPIKLMSQMTRKSTLCKGRIGHYEVEGSLYMKHNYEFANIAYGGMIGLTFRRGEPENVDMDKVREAYEVLKRQHPLLQRYSLPQRAEQILEYHVQEHNQHIRVNNNWRDHILMPSEGVNPNAAEVNYNDLVMGNAWLINVFFLFLV